MKVNEIAFAVGAIVLAACFAVFGTDLSVQHQADIARLSTASMGLVSTPDAGSTVRGLLYRVAPDGRQYPAVGVAVRLNHPRYGPSAFAYTGNDGMFYLYNVPPGVFTLEVWISNTNVQRFTIEVLDQPNTDIKPIRIP